MHRPQTKASGSPIGVHKTPARKGRGLLYTGGRRPRMTSDHGRTAQLLGSQGNAGGNDGGPFSPPIQKIGRSVTTTTPHVGKDLDKQIFPILGNLNCYSPRGRGKSGGDRQ